MKRTLSTESFESGKGLHSKNRKNLRYSLRKYGEKDDLEWEPINPDDSSSSSEMQEDSESSTEMHDIDEKRQFKPNWLKLLKWLRFNHSTGIASCAACSLFPDIASRNSRLVQGFDGPYKLDTFRKHGKTKKHQKCVNAYKFKFESKANKIEDEDKQFLSSKIIKIEREFEEEQSLSSEMNKSVEQSELIIPDRVGIIHQEDLLSSMKIPVNIEEEKFQGKFKPHWLKFLKWLKFDNSTGVVSCAICLMFPDIADIGCRFVQGFKGPYELATFKKHVETSNHQKCVDAYKTKMESENASFTKCTELCVSNLEGNDSKPRWSLQGEENDFFVPKIVSSFMWDLKKYTLVPKHAKVELDMFESASKPGAYERDSGNSDASSGRFVAPRTGFYNFNARMHIRLSETANHIPRSELFSVQICIDSSLMEKTSLETVSGLGPGDMMTVSVNGLLHLKVSQYVSVFVDNASNYDLAFMDGSQFSGYLVGV